MTTSVLPCDLSPSSLDRYRTCPRRFLWQDIERLPFEENPTAQQLIGIAVHKALEGLFRREPWQRSPEVLERLLGSAWSRVSAVHPLDSVAERDAALSKARALLGRFAKTFDLSVKPLRIEQTLEVKLRNGTRIRTRVDRIDPLGGGGVRAVDYKTGAFQLDSRDMPRDTACIIHLLAAEQAGYRVERLSLLYLSTGEEIYWEPERDDVEFAGERLRDILRELRDDRDFAPVPGGACVVCPFRDRCDVALAAGVAAPSLLLH